MTMGGLFGLGILPVGDDEPTLRPTRKRVIMLSVESPWGKDETRNLAMEHWRAFQDQGIRVNDVEVT